MPTPGRNQAHYRGTYRRRADKVKELAYANPNTRCRRCGLTLHEYRTRHPTLRWQWQAGHVVDGEATSPLAAEHADCNERAGGRRGADMARAKREPSSPNA